MLFRTKRLRSSLFSVEGRKEGREGEGEERVILTDRFFNAHLLPNEITSNSLAA